MGRYHIDGERFSYVFTRTGTMTPAWLDKWLGIPQFLRMEAGPTRMLSLFLRLNIIRLVED